MKFVMPRNYMTIHSDWAPPSPLSVLTFAKRCIMGYPCLSPPFCGNRLPPNKPDIRPFYFATPFVVKRCHIFFLCLFFHVFFVNKKPRETSSTKNITLFCCRKPPFWPKISGETSTNPYRPKEVFGRCMA